MCDGSHTSCVKVHRVGAHIHVSIWTTDFCMSVHEDMDKGFLHMCLSVCVQFMEVHGMSGANSSSVDKGGYVYMCELGTI